MNPYDEKLEIIKKTAGKRIKAERTEAGYSQADLAEALLLSRDSRQTVSNWENGRTLPSLDILLAMCDLFECEIGYLLGEEGYEGKTRVVTDVHKITGLSHKAIENVCLLKELDELPPKPGQLKILNSLLENMVDFSLFLTQIELYLNIAKEKIGKQLDWHSPQAIYHMTELKKRGYVVTTPKELSRVRFEDSTETLKKLLDKIAAEQRKEEHHGISSKERR